MNGKVKQFIGMVLLAGVLLVIYGCKKSEPAAQHEHEATAPPAQTGEVTAAMVE